VIVFTVPEVLYTVMLWPGLPVLVSMHSVHSSSWPQILPIRCRNWLRPYAC
jgi:hypothetical protein